MSLLASVQDVSLAAQSAGPGAIPGTSTVVVNSVNFGGVETGTGNGDAPVVTVVVDIAPDVISNVRSVEVTLRGPNGYLVSETADAGENLERFELALSSTAIAGEYEIYEIRIMFEDDSEGSGFPSGGLVLTPDNISSLIESRYIELANENEDITPPEVSDLLLPIRSILVDNDLPGGLGGGDSAEITFQGTFSDEGSGLNIIEFEFDIGPGFPAVIGGEIGLFGDLSNGERQLSTLNTEAPAGSYAFELLRVSDDRGNTVLYTADDLAGLGYQTVVHVVSQEALQDATSPTVSSFSLSSNEVTLAGADASLIVNLSATDEGFDATGVQTVTIILVSDLGSRYQLEADVVFGEGDNATAELVFARDFPAGEFTIERLSVNDGAYNRQDITLDNMTLTVVNAEGGDIASNRLRGDETDNVIIARSGDDTVVGGEGSDSLQLGDGDDQSFAGPGDAGNDTVVGGAGNDLIAAGAGDDYIIGGRLISTDFQTSFFTTRETRLDGKDTLYGGAGDDTIFGGSPRFSTNDQGQEIYSDFGSVAPDQIYAGAGDDFVQASYGNDVLGGGVGADTVRGGAGHDVVYGGRGDAGATGVNDVIWGQDGNDEIFASGGNDRVLGGADNDTLFGGAGDDTLVGGGGHDDIYGGAGDDILMGGSGADTFFFQPGSGADILSDFDTGEDVLFLSQYATRFASVGALRNSAEITMLNGQTGILFDLGEGDQLFLGGVTSAESVTIIF